MGGTLSLGASSVMARSVLSAVGDFRGNPETIVQRATLATIITGGMALAGNAGALVV